MVQALQSASDMDGDRVVIKHRLIFTLRGMGLFKYTLIGLDKGNVHSKNESSGKIKGIGILGKKDH